MVDLPSQAERQSRSAEKPRPIRVSAQCGACVVALLVLKLRLGTFVARLAIIRIAPETRSAGDLIRGSTYPTASAITPITMAVAASMR
ncbi:MAG: hypothetical protein ACREVA_11215, partial [Burkholderiales bacterium]